MNAFVIDTFEFCRLKQQRDGEIAVADLPRLAEESIDKFGAIRWALQGGNDRLGHPQLTLSVTGSVQLVCQRCLTPFVFDIVSESILVLASDEASADAIDGLLNDDEVEVIVGSKDFNVAYLIEDEVLLAIPTSPRHELCPDQLMPEMSKNEDRISPFAVLKGLKR
jgi:uncharacterized protein